MGVESRHAVDTTLVAQCQAVLFEGVAVKKDGCIEKPVQALGIPSASRMTDRPCEPKSHRKRQKRVVKGLISERHWYASPISLSACIILFSFACAGKSVNLRGKAPDWSMKAEF